jgi:hypothetical protein
MSQAVNRAEVYVVETPAFDEAGERHGTFRVYVPTEARAREIAAPNQLSTIRSIALDLVPEKARANMLRANREHEAAERRGG